MSAYCRQPTAAQHGASCVATLTLALALALVRTLALSLAWSLP